MQKGNKAIMAYSLQNFQVSYYTAILQCKIFHLIKQVNRNNYLSRCHMELNLSEQVLTFELSVTIIFKWKAQANEASVRWENA